LNNRHRNKCTFNDQLKRVISLSVLITALHLLLPLPAIAENLKSANDSECQKIELPVKNELVDFDSMRSHYSLQHYRGIIIGKIKVINLPVFNLHDPDENNVFYRFINNIHSPTKDDVIHDQLLFKEGDILNPRLLTESERILRENSFLVDAIILPYQRCEKSLDLIVVVRDLWTLLPKLYLSRKGGDNEYGLTLEDKNIFGTGNAIFFQFISDPERDSKSIGFASKNLNDSRINLNLAYSDNTDGINKKLELIRPFYALDTKWSFGMKLNENSFKESMEALNRSITSFDHNANKYQLFAGYSRGLINGFTRRYSFGFSRTEDIFETADITSSIPADRVLAYPWAGYSIIEDDFAIYKNLNSLYRTEDAPVGVKFSSALGIADKLFGSELSQWIFSLSLSDTPITLENHLLNTKYQINGFWDRDMNDLVNTVNTIDLSYFWLITENQRLYAGLSYDHGINLSLDNLLPLGGDKGLRGYPSEYLLGEHRFLLNLEHRFFLNQHYFNLFRIASVIFFDMGKTGAGNNSILEDSKLLTSAGVGIRINSSKTNISRIIHIDLAFPLNEKDELSDYQFRITADATF